MPLDKVVLLPVWAEVPYLFDPQYRAALAWAEEVTRVSETHASDEAYAAAAAAFEPRALVALTIATAAMNAFNRQIGRASCKERVCTYVEISVVAVSLKKQKNKKKQ